MSKKFLTMLSLGAALLLSTSANVVFAADMKVSGAAAVAGAIVTPNKAAIESETGLVLKMTVNGDGNGLKDLASGAADVAMIAAPIKVTEAVLNKTAAGSLSVAGFEVAPLGAVGIKFVINATNPVKSLSQAQLKDIFTGKITSWKDVGGADAPIVVVAEGPGFGTRSSIVGSLLGGTDIVNGARIVPGLAQVAQTVGEVPEAIGYGNAKTVNPKVTVIRGYEAKQVLGLATKGAPSAEVQKLIASMEKFGAAIE